MLVVGLARPGDKMQAADHRPQIMGLPITQLPDSRAGFTPTSPAPSSQLPGPTALCTALYRISMVLYSSMTEYLLARHFDRALVLNLRFLL